MPPPPPWTTPTAAPNLLTPAPAAPAPTAAPAGVSGPIAGDWLFRAHPGENRAIGGALRFAVEGGRLVGTYIAPNGKTAPLSDVARDGDRISFAIPGQLGSWKLTGVVSGDHMNGTFETVSRVVPWEATRAKPGESVPAPANPAAPSGSPAPAPTPR